MRIKAFIITVAMVLLCCAPAFAGHLDNYTRDSHVKEALVMLERVGATEVFENLQENSVKISFYDLSQISYKYMNQFAVNSVDSFGNRYILINTKYMSCSPEEIACIIAHESFHKLKVATYDEETLATQKEAKYWALLKNSRKVYTQTALLERLDRLVELDNNSTETNNLIRDRIGNSAFYRAQLAIR